MKKATLTLLMLVALNYLYCANFKDMKTNIVEKPRWTEKLYSVRNTMKARCNNKNCKVYHHYGGRGIKVCDEWMESYEAFKTWCLNNGYKEGMSIDRINNDGDYTPDNCRFATRVEQMLNARSTRMITIDGVTKNIVSWCKFYGLSTGHLYKRLEKNNNSYALAMYNNKECSY